MALDFPNSPVNGQVYIGDNGVTYRFDGVKWIGQAAEGSLTTNELVNGAYIVTLNDTGNLVIPLDGDILRNGVSVFDNLGSGGNIYGNANVAAYLPTYNGNIKISNITFSDLSQQRTAYTGQSWRTLLESNLQSKPTWLAYVPDGSKPTIGVNFGFDSTGMWFTGNANDQHAYPIRTNVNFYETDSTEIITTIQYNNISDDHGFAIFNSATTQPFWRFGTDSTRIAYQISVATPELRGRTTSSVAGAPILVIGNNYTIRMVYDPLAPTNKITVELYDGVSITGALLDTRTINEQLPAGSYEIGFDADQDNLALKSYYTSLTIKTLTNAVFNEIEIINDLAVGGNISSGAVLYSPATSSNWSGTPPTTIGAAIDRLASVVKALNGGTGA